MEEIHRVMVKNLKKHPYDEWVGLNIFIDTTDFVEKEVLMAFIKLELKDFDLEKERDNLPMEFGLVQYFKGTHPQKLEIMV